MPFPCCTHAVPKRVRFSFPFDLHSAAVFDSHMPCRTRAMPRPCRSESDFLRPRHSAAWALHGHGMCELALKVTLPVKRGPSYLKDIDQDIAAHIAVHYHQLEC
jgi:hypothetical protein